MHASGAAAHGDIIGVGRAATWKNVGKRQCATPIEKLVGVSGQTLRTDSPGRSATATHRMTKGSTDAVEDLSAWLETLAPELRAAIDDLPPAFREAVWLRDVEEFSYAEIASMLEIPQGTVMSRISRGRRMLFERLNQLKATHA